MICTWISRTSAVALAVGGVAFLFASDSLLPQLIPQFPRKGGWIGQILAAAWLALAVLNWHSRSQLLGGIYGRAVVSTNSTYFFLTTLSLLKWRDPGPSSGFWLLVAVHGVFAVIYCFLLFKGPFERDLREYAART